MVSGRAPHVVRSRREWHCALTAPVVLKNPQRRRSCIAADCSCGGGDTVRVAVRGERAEQAKNAAEVEACEMRQGYAAVGAVMYVAENAGENRWLRLLIRNTLYVPLGAGHGLS